MRPRRFDTPGLPPYPRASPSAPFAAGTSSSRTLDRSVKRWLALALGLSVALAGLAFLAIRGTTLDPREQIDARSRSALEQVLVDAERKGAER
jgi:hypothetical protein